MSPKSTAAVCLAQLMIPRAQPSLLKRELECATCRLPQLAKCPEGTLESGRKSTFFSEKACRADSHMEEFVGSTSISRTSSADVAQDFTPIGHRLKL